MMNQDSRNIIYELLIRINHKKAYPDIVLRNYFESYKQSARDRGFITEVVYGVIRWKLKLNYFVSVQTNHKSRNKKIMLLLIIAAYQILHLDTVPGYAAVNESVNMAKKRFGSEIASFVNAVLRKIVLNKNMYHKIDTNDEIASISINYSFPEWMIRYWLQYMDKKDVIDVCSSLNTRAKNTYRVNALYNSRDDFLKKTEKYQHISGTSISPSGINITDKLDKSIDDYYTNGLISIQDEASQLISIILDPKPSEIILDLCSAPGTKSIHIAEIMEDKGQIISCDINHSRLKLLEKDCRRLGLNSMKLLCADSTIIHTVLKGKFDKILVDAPCSGFGTIKNNPDIKWSKTHCDINDLAQLQYKLLDSASKLLKDGGILLYSVCTISYLENEDVVSKFLKAHPDFRIIQDQNYQSQEINRLFNRNGYFTSFKYLHIMDGFFAVKFTKLGRL